MSVQGSHRNREKPNDKESAFLPVRPQWAVAHEKLHRTNTLHGTKSIVAMLTQSDVHWTGCQNVMCFDPHMYAKFFLH